MQFYSHEVQELNTELIWQKQSQEKLLTVRKGSLK